MKLTDSAAIRSCAMEVRRVALRTGKFVYVHVAGPMQLRCSPSYMKDEELVGVYGEHSPVSFIVEDIVDHARRVGAYLEDGR